MKIRYTILCFFSFVFFLEAQETFSYITDRKFSDPSELIGYNFKPDHMEVPDEFAEDISAGEYSFGVTLNNLYVNGGDLQGVYSINNINPTEYGFKLNLMNARDPTVQGHLKIIQNKRNQVDALVFKRATKDKEIIFFLPDLTDEQYNKEADYFTDKYDTELESPDSIWGKEIKPFLNIHTSKNIQQRLTYADSTMISFEEVYRVVDKTKKQKKKADKKKKKADKKKAENSENSEEEEVVADDEFIAETALEAENLAKVEALLKLSSLKEIEEAVLELDPEFQKKIKVVKEYYINIRSILTYDDGSIEDKTKKIEIKKIQEKEDSMAGPGAERYQIDFTTSKGEHIYLYLTGKRTVSSFEINDSKYLMRGH